MRERGISVRMSRMTLDAPSPPSMAPSTVSRKTSQRVLTTFAISEGPLGCGLVVPALGAGALRAAWFESEALVLVGDLGLVRIGIGAARRRTHWPAGDRAGTVDVMEMAPLSDGGHAVAAGRQLWRLPLIPSAIRTAPSAHALHRP